MSETDRELLELAAKAARYELALPASPDMRWIEQSKEFVAWNPLEDDGDALRLAVNLCLTVQVGRLDGIVVVTSNNDSRIYASENMDVAGSKCAATRRAIVCAAAEIGKLIK